MAEQLLVTLQNSNIKIRNLPIGASGTLMDINIGFDTKYQQAMIDIGLTEGAIQNTINVKEGKITITEFPLRIGKE